MIFSFDSSVLIDFVRAPARHPGFDVLSESAEEVAISSVVVFELEAGAKWPKARRQLEEGPVGLLLREAAIIAPDEEDWVRTGRLIGERTEWARTASRQNDVLLAHQCARLDWLLITRDADFAEIARYVPGLRIAPPRPI